MTLQAAFAFSQDGVAARDRLAGDRGAVYGPLTAYATRAGILLELLTLLVRVAFVGARHSRNWCKPEKNWFLYKWALHTLSCDINVKPC